MATQRKFEKRNGIFINAAWKEKEKTIPEQISETANHFANATHERKAVQNQA